MRLWLAAPLLAFALPATAQELHSCQDLARADALVEPWEENTRTFANGKIRIALLDRIEPAAGALYLLVLSPPDDEPGGRQCRVLGFGDGMGFAGIYFERITADYDPARGLTISVPTQFYLSEQGFTNSMMVHMTINQATGEIAVQSELGRE